MNKILACLVIAILATACSSTPSSEMVQTAIAETTIAQITDTYTPAPTATITSTHYPTNTPPPTKTPRPTLTPRPTNTPTPPPSPKIFSGTGDNVVDLEKWEGLALLHIKYTGYHNFVVWSVNDKGEETDLLVNAIGNYEGTMLLDVMNDEDTKRLSIKSSGKWEVELLPFDSVNTAFVPTTIEGSGDDVILLFGINQEPDLLRVDASNASHNFVIWGYGSSVDLLVNDIAPYSGTIMITKDLLTDSGDLLLEIKAVGPWKIDVTGR